MTARRLALTALVLGALITTPGHAACVGCGRAGAGRAPLTVPAGTPLAGYGSLTRRLIMPDLFGRHPHAYWFKPHRGQLDPVFARALIVEAAGQRLVWLTADLVAVDRGFTERVARRLAGVGIAGRVVVSASHTHSGPGAYLDSRLFGALAVDDEDDEVREAVVEALIAAARRAASSLGEARIGAAAAPGPALTVGRLGEPVDDELIVAKIVDGAGRPVAVLWNYAIHGTMLGPGNLALSGDVMGLASQRLERALGVPALFVNGAVGDVSPRRHGRAEALAAAGDLAAAVQRVWQRITPSRPPTLRIAARGVRLPPPRLSLRNCFGRWIPTAATVPLGRFVPRDAELVAGRLGDLAWITVPGELQSRLGERVKRAAPAPAMVAGVSNDYLGYFVAAAAYGRPGYVACASLYGPDGGERLTAAAVDLLRGLANGAR